MKAVETNEKSGVMPGKVNPPVRQIPSPKFGTPIGEWHFFFAWRPVKTWDQRWVWMKRIWRQAVQPKEFLSGSPTIWYRYHNERGYVPNSLLDRKDSAYHD